MDATRVRRECAVCGATLTHVDSTNCYRVLSAMLRPVRVRVGAASIEKLCVSFAGVTQWWAHQEIGFPAGLRWRVSVGNGGSRQNDESTCTTCTEEVLFDQLQTLSRHLFVQFRVCTRRPILERVTLTSFTQQATNQDDQKQNSDLACTRAACRIRHSLITKGPDYE